MPVARSMDSLFGSERLPPRGRQSFDSQAIVDALNAMKDAQYRQRIASLEFQATVGSVSDIINHLRNNR